MTKNPLSTVEDSPQVVMAWLDTLCLSLGWTDRGRAYMLLRETLHALRDFLTIAEAVELSAQLPVLVRGIYFDGWVPARAPAHPRSRDDFFRRVTSAFSRTPLEDPERAIRAVFALLRSKVSQGEIEQVIQALRQPLRDLWE